MVGREAIIQKTTSSLLLESSRTVTHWEGIQCAGYVYFLWSGPHGLIIIHHLLDVSPGTCYLTSSSFGLLHWKRKLAVDQPYYTNEGLKLSLASVHGVCHKESKTTERLNWTELSFSITRPFGLPPISGPLHFSPNLQPPSDVQPLSSQPECYNKLRAILPNICSWLPPIHSPWHSQSIVFNINQILHLAA